MMTTYGSAYRGPPSLPQLSSAEDEYVPRANSVQNYAYKEDPNSRFRPSMEDGHRAVDSFMGDPNMGYFSVFDGHGGPEAVEYCKRRMHEEVRKALSETPEDVAGAYHRCFQRVDNQLRLTGAMSSGTTAIVAIVRKENHQRMLYVANVGDSRAYLLSNTGCEELTYAHNGSDPGEASRIMKGGGILMNGRVAGQLAVSRALGDHHLKSSGVICDPHVIKRPVAFGSTLIMGSDGIWDVIPPHDLPSLMGRNSLEIADYLLRRAIEGGSQDNACLLAVCF